MTSIVKLPDQSTLRNSIFRLEDEIRQIPGNGIEESGIRHVHHFAPGVYAREMIVPAGVLLTGAVHRTEHVSIFLSGRMLVPDDNGGSVEISGPMVEIGMPGIKRVGLALEEVRWITVHPTDETDLDTLEAELVTNDPVEAQALADRVDYRRLGISDSLIERMREIEVHHVPVEGVEFARSMRHGIGLFATDSFHTGAIIGAAIVDGRLMACLRYANHSADPNAQVFRDSGENATLMALRDIQAGEEITVDYRMNLLEHLI